MAMRWSGGRWRRRAGDGRLLRLQADDQTRREGDDESDDDDEFGHEKLTPPAAPRYRDGSAVSLSCNPAGGVTAAASSGPAAETIVGSWRIFDGQISSAPIRIAAAAEVSHDAIRITPRSCAAANQVCPKRVIAAGGSSTSG